MARGKRAEYGSKTFASKFEARVAEQLDKLGVKWLYEEVRFPYKLPITKARCNDCGSIQVHGERIYTPDFYLPDRNIYLEVKGHFKPHDRKILPIIKKANDIDLRLLFLFNNKIGKNRYSDWCTQRKFLFAFKEVPEEWVK